MVGGPKEEEAATEADMDAFAFGTFKLVPRERGLYEGERVVEIGGRAFDVLVELVRHAGVLVTARDLRAKVWSDAVVEDANLRVHIASLRKALRDGRDGRRFIATSVGTGYTFVEPVTRVRSAKPTQARGSPQRLSSLPIRTRMIGREQLEGSIAEAVSRRRLVTLVGPGGIGKTSLGIAVANRSASTHADGALFVDLASVTTEHIFDAFASALGTRAVSSAVELGNSLADRDMLVVLDNCEHVIDAAAEIVGELLGRTSRLHIVATSREALRAEGEWVYRVPSLETPRPDATLSAEEALGFSSVELFVDRAAVSGLAYELAVGDVATVTEICRKLDGIPLAIELAASRVDVLGIAGLNAALQMHLGFALKGPRSASPRHRTLRGVFEWSYATLSPIEQRTVRALSVFRGPFTLECAPAVASEHASERSLVYDAVLGLIDKSMMTTDQGGDDRRFRLLEITREYGLEQLRACGELEIVERRYANYHRAVCEDAEQELATRPASDWIEAHRWRMDDVRAALGWCFGPSGDSAVGVALTVASIALWFEVCSLEDYRQYVERALAHIRDDRSPRAAETEVKLRLALGITILHTIGPIPAMTEAIASALQVAEQLSPRLHMQALGVMWVDGFARADYGAARAMADRFTELAMTSGDPAALIVSNRLLGFAKHLHGSLAEGRHHAERVLAVPSQRLVYSTPIQVDGRVSMLTLVARSQWLEGYAEKAAETSHQGLELALRLRHVGAICFTLALGAIPVAVWSGDIGLADRYIAQMIASASRVSFGYWLAWARAYERALRLPAGHGLQAGDLGMGAKQCDHLVTVRADLLDDATLARVEAGEVGWCAPEVQRAQAVRIAASGDAWTAARLLREALATAKRQGALGWELRIATDLARLQGDRGDPTEARALLTAALSQFTEGAGTIDHRRAAALLASPQVG